MCCFHKVEETIMGQQERAHNQWERKRVECGRVMRRDRRAMEKREGGEKPRKSGQRGEKRNTPKQKNYDGEKGRETTGPSSILLDGTVLSLAHVLSSLSKTQPPGHCEEILASNTFFLWL